LADVTREELDDEAFQIRHVFATYGLAMYQAQVLERGLANALTVARTHSVGGTREDFDAFLDQHQKETMGRLLNLLRPHVAADDALLVDLGEVLEKRNRLAHRFFREHDMNFMSFSGREEMLGELLAAADEFGLIDLRLKPVINRFLRSRGLSDDEVDRVINDEYTRLVDEAVQRDQE
jgi:hypothetical protein